MNPSNREAYEPAMQSRKNNGYLNDYQFYLDKLRAVQNTYHVQLKEFPELGYAFRICLLWDYDPLWGRFDLGKTQGLFLVDPGPKFLLSDNEPPQSFRFVWRWFRKEEPDGVATFPEFTRGEIRINVLQSTLEGHFMLLSGDGDFEARESYCGFRARKHRGPGVVPYSLEDTVEEWNHDSTTFAPHDVIRQGLSFEELEEYRRHRDADKKSVKRRKIK